MAAPAKCPCGDPRCLLWLPRPDGTYLPMACADCYMQAVARHYGRTLRKAAA
jgi:hypothetical protein